MHIIRNDPTQSVVDSGRGLAEILAQARLHSPLREGTGGGYVTIGVFDGVHRGHQQLVTDMVEAAHSTGNVAIALTFDPHPATTLGYDPPPLLTGLEERAELLSVLGLDIQVVLPFTQDIARTLATDFVEALVRHLHLIELWGGPDFAFGHRREGNVPFLQRLGAEHGFTVHIVEPLTWEGELVSSSRVRAALKVGDLSQATGCLGRPYRLVGVVAAHGYEVSHSAGVPVARVSIPPERLMPASGVYASLAHTERLETHPAVIRVDPRLAFARHTPVIEVHLLDLDADLHGQGLALDFIARLRGERSFSSASALAEQAHKDIAQARIVLGVDIPSARS